MTVFYNDGFQLRFLYLERDSDSSFKVALFISLEC